MVSESEYYIVRRSSVPEVLRKVVEANKLLASGEVRTANEAAERVGISRSSYYKYKGEIEEFHDSTRGTTFTLLCEINDVTGLLSDILRIIAESRANILTIHQSVPLGGTASVSITVSVTEDTQNVSRMISRLESTQGVRKVRIAGRG